MARKKTPPDTPPGPSPEDDEGASARRGEAIGLRWDVQARALYDVLVNGFEGPDDYYLTAPVDRMALIRKYQGPANRERVKALLEALFALQSEGGLEGERLLLAAAEGNRVVRRYLMAGPPLPYAERVRRLSSLVTADNAIRLLESPLFVAFLAAAWTLAAEDPQDNQAEAEAARHLLRAFALALEAPLPANFREAASTQETKARPTVRNLRTEAVVKLLEKRLPAAVELLRRQDEASAGLLDPDQILEALRRWYQEIQRASRERDGIAEGSYMGGKLIIGPPFDCPTCERDDLVLAARVLASYRRARADGRVDKRFRLETPAAVIVLHRCPEELLSSEPRAYGESELKTLLKKMKMRQKERGTKR